MGPSACLGTCPGTPRDADTGGHLLGFSRRLPKYNGLSCISLKDTFRTRPPEPEGKVLWEVSLEI